MIYFIVNDQMLYLCGMTRLPYQGFSPGEPFSRDKNVASMLTVTGFDLWLSVLALGIVCTIYTALVSAVSPGEGRGRDEVRRGDGKRRKRRDKLRI